MADEDDKLAEALVNLIKPVIAQMILTMLTGPAMRTLVGNVSRLNDTIAGQNELLAKLNVMMHDLQAIRDSRTRSKQFDTLMSLRLRDEMQAAGCTPVQIDTVIRTLMNHTREGEAARRAAGRVMAGKRPRRPPKEPLNKSISTRSLDDL